MKYVPFIGLVVFLLSCQDDKEDLKVTLVGNTAEAKRNDVDWKGNVEISLESGTDTLTFLGIGSSSDENVVVMKIRFVGAGNYSLVNNQGRYYTTVGGDVITSDYKIASGTTGELEITSYEPLTKKLEGNFHLSLKRLWSNPENGNENIDFKDGVFSGTIRP